MENFKDVVYWVATVFGIGVTWGHSQRRIYNLESKVSEHMQDSKESNYLTTSHHDRLQMDCQKLWMSELAHIKDTLADMRQEIKDIKKT
jgi:hypothetical protein